MSNFKKMKLVDEHEPKDIQRSVFQTEKYTTSKHLKRISDLDNQMNEIINSNLDEIKKAKLYSQALRKFLTFKKKHEEDEEIAKRQAFQNIIVPKTAPVKKPKVKVKKPKVKVGKKNKVIITPKKRNIITPKAPKKLKRFRRVTPPRSSTTISPRSSSSSSPTRKYLTKKLTTWAQEGLSKGSRIVFKGLPHLVGSSHSPKTYDSDEYTTAGDDTVFEQEGDAWIIY
jgi:CRISPR/Cas system-associated endoribonuclease Cas2